MKDADASVNCNCTRKAVIFKYALFDACADEDNDVAAQVQWRTTGGKSGKTRPVKPGTAEELGEYWTNMLNELPFSGWLSALDGTPRSQTASKKQKTIARPQNAARRDDFPYGLNGLRKTQPANDYRMVTENEPFTFYQDTEAYIKSYQLSKRLITSFKPRQVPQKASEPTGEPNRAASVDQTADPPDQLPVAQTAENNGLHLHIARMLKSLLAESWTREDSDTGVKQAQNTWYQHLCSEVTRLEERDPGTSKVAEPNTPESEIADISVVGNVAKRNSKYRAMSRIGDPSKSSVKIVNCEVFPSIDAITSGKISGSYNSRKRQSNETPDKKSIRTRSARWLNVFSLMGNTRMTVGDNNMSQVFIGPQRQLTAVNAGGQPRELKFMRTMAELIKEYDSAQKPDSSGSLDSSSEPV